MVQANNPGDNETALQHRSDPQPLEVYRPRSWVMPVTAGVLTAAGGGGLAYFIYLSHAIADIGAAYSFVAQNTLSLFIFLAVVAQALIYWGQRNLMLQQSRDAQNALEIERGKIAPRLLVDEVTVSGLEIGLTPVFMVVVVNEGATDANDVTFFMKVGRESISVKSREQSIKVPAHGKQIQFIKWKSTLSQAEFIALNSSFELEVSGYYQYGEVKRQSFCYRYVPWQEGKPPEGVPRFIPCHVDPFVDIEVTIGGVEAKASTGTVGPVITKTPPEADIPEEKTDPQSEDDGKNPN